MKTSLYCTVFATGACVMVIELTASRLLAPFFGTSLYVWTNVIGIILVALTVGYWIGGKVAERTKDAHVLSGIILAAGAFALVIPYAVGTLAAVTTDGLLAARAPGAAVIFIGSFLVLLFLFAVPILLLGAVSPFVIRLLTLGHTEVGEISGRVFAVSTAGSIIGTFLPVLLLVPVFGSKKTILLAAFVLLLVGAAGLALRRAAVGGMAALLIGLLLLTPQGLRARPGLIEEKETPYQYLSVQDEPDLGRTLRFNEGLGIQSLIPKEGERTGLYWEYVAPVLAATGEGKEKKSALMVGVAGGSIAREIADAWGDRVKLTGIEIDPAVIAVGKKYFGLSAIPDFEIRSEDGRMALARNPEQYDLIIVDAFANQLYIPPHLATVEFFTLVRERLAPGGALSMNVIAPSEDSQLLRRLIASLQRVFPYVGAYHLPDQWNFAVVASPEPIIWSELPAKTPPAIRDLAEQYVANFREFPPEAARPLTDDDAPLEILTDMQVFEALKTGRN